MAFPARYKGICKNCSSAIEIGQYITWDRTKKGSAYHSDCSNPNARPPEKITSVSEIQTALDKAIETIERMSKGIEMGKDGVGHLVTTSTALVPVPSHVAKAKAKPLAKDNALWFELLQALCSSFQEELIRVLLLGPPGTGKSKTSLILTDTPYRVTMTEGMGVEDLIGMYQLIKSETVWVDGPCVRAMKEGKRILIDEIDHHPTEVGSLLYALLDDAPSIMLPTGENVVAAKGYGVIATTNSNVTALPEAVLDRFEVVLPAIQPHPDALTQFDSPAMRDAVANHFRGLDASPWRWSGKPTLRRMRAYARLLPIVGEANAASLAFGSAGKELLSVLTTAARGKL